MTLILYLCGVLIERISVIVTIAFILTRLTWFRKLFEGKLGRNGRYLSILFFGLLGILGTYTGIVVNLESLGYATHLTDISYSEAIVNARVLGVAIGGILGGPVVGFWAGVLAGVHRYFIGGFTDVACSLSTICEGLLAGLIVKYVLKNHHVTIAQAFGIGFIAEVSQMIIILLVAKPFDKALHLVQIIGLPMILANSAGIAIFIAIVQSVIQKEQEASANFARKALLIADRTLPHLRQGLNRKSAYTAANIILEMTEVAAVSLTNHDEILAFVGLGSDHHKAGSPIITEATKLTLLEGKSCVAKNRYSIGCTTPSCPLQSAIVLPLKQQDIVIGSLKLYFSEEGDVDQSLIGLANGLANLFSTQLELARIDEQQRLLADAEIKALQAQVNPHFLFNSLNSIVALIRLDPDLARQISISLGQFLRSNIHAGHQRWRSLSAELTHIKDYLAIEQVRFSDKISVEYDIDESITDVQVPPLILLPLVENSIKYGFSSLARLGKIKITVKKSGDAKLSIIVHDNGVGIPPDQLNKILAREICESTKGTGFGIYSVTKRLSNIYGEQANVDIKSTPQNGTTVTLTIPKTFNNKN